MPGLGLASQPKAAQGWGLAECRVTEWHAMNQLGRARLKAPLDTNWLRAESRRGHHGTEIASSIGIANLRRKMQ